MNYPMAIVVLGLLLTQTQAQTARKAKFEAIIPEGMEGFQDYGYSPAVRAGDFVFVAGVVAGLPKDSDGMIIDVNEENMVASYERALDQIARVLEAAGASWGDVVEMTTYHTDLPSQGKIFLKVKNRYLQPPYPAWTAIDIDRLWPDNGITEIKVVAYAPIERK